MKKIPFGIRVYVVGLIAFLLADLTFHMTIPLELTGAHYALRELFHRIAGFAYLIVLGSILKARVRRFVFLAYLAVMGYFVFKLGQSAIAAPQFAAQTPGVFSGSVFSVFGWSLALPLAIAFTPPLFLYWWTWFKECEFYRMYLEGLGGAATFGSIKSFQKHPAKLNQPLIPTDDAGVTSPGIFIGRTLFRHDPIPRLIGIEDESHVCVISPNGGGKSVSTIYNVAATYAGDMIFADPKGEHTKNTFHRRCSKAFLEEKGIPIPEGVDKFMPNGEAYVFDLCGITGVPSCCYNPLHTMDIHDPNIRARIYAIVHGLVTSEKQKHFEENPKDFIAGMIAYVLERFPKEPEKMSLPYILDIVSGINEDGFADEEKFNEVLLDMLVCQGAGGLAQQAAALYQKWGEKERGSHFGVIMRSLKCFGDPAIRACMSRNDIDFSNVGTKTNAQGKPVVQSIYVAIPDDRMDELKRLVRVFLSDAMVSMRSRKHHPKHRTLYMLDEFPLFGYIETIEKGFGVLRGYHQKLCIFAQGLGQLKTHYPTMWNTMIAQSSSIFFGQPPTDLETLGFISKALGDHNISFADIRGFGVKRSDSTPRALLTPTEIAALIGKGKNKQIVFPSEGYPLLLERLCFKSLSIGGKCFSGLPLDGLRGHFPKHKKS